VTAENSLKKTRRKNEWFAKFRVASDDKEDAE